MLQAKKGSVAKAFGEDSDVSLMLSSHSRFLSIDLDVHQQNKECQHMPTEELFVNKVND